MKEIKTLQEKKDLAFNILNKIDSFCKENNIKYYLAYGTLLGCIRHNGYIPWDDDIDLWMKRNDYEIFIDKFSKQCDNINLKINSYKTTSNYNKTFIQVYDPNTKIFESSFNNDYDLGIFVDIYPLNELPVNKTSSKLCLFKLQIIKILLICSRLKADYKYFSFIKRKVIGVIGFIINKGNFHLLDRYEHIIKKYSKEPSNKLHTEFAKNKGKNIILDKKDFDEICLKKFEGKSVPVPLGYDQILTTIYGDYMAFPPIEEQIPHHEYDAFYIK